MSVVSIQVIIYQFDDHALIMSVKLILIAGPPLDGRPVHIVHSFHTWLIVIFYTLATLGIFFATACFMFNLIFRKRK